jgi:hypothetical protein
VIGPPSIAKAFGAASINLNATIQRAFMLGGASAVVR